MVGTVVVGNGVDHVQVAHERIISEIDSLTAAKKVQWSNDRLPAYPDVAALPEENPVADAGALGDYQGLAVQVSDADHDAAPDPVSKAPAVHLALHGKREEGRHQKPKAPQLGPQTAPAAGRREGAAVQRGPQDDLFNRCAHGVRRPSAVHCRASEPALAAAGEG